MSKNSALFVFTPVCRVCINTDRNRRVQQISRDDLPENGGFNSAADTSFFPAKAALPDAAFFYPLVSRYINAI